MLSLLEQQHLFDPQKEEKLHLFYFFLKYTEIGTPVKSNFSLNLFSRNRL